MTKVLFGLPIDDYLLAALRSGLGLTNVFGRRQYGGPDYFNWVGPDIRRGLTFRDQSIDHKSSLGYTEFDFLKSRRECFLGLVRTSGRDHRLEVGIYTNLRLYRRIFDYWFRYLIQKEIDVVVVASDAVGTDRILLSVSEMLKIPCLVVGQVFESRFFWTTNWKDYGIFDDVPPLFDSAVVANFYPEFPAYIDLEARAFGLPGRRPVASRLRTFVFGGEDTASRWQKLSFYSTEMHYRSINAKKRLASAVACADEHLAKSNSNVAFYPLPFQPESQCHSSRDDWQDPIDVIHFLLRLLPPEALIVLKEHPAMRYGTHERGDLFYEDLSHFDRNRIGWTSEDTNWVVKRSRIVVSQGGTTGYWSAIQGIPTALFTDRAWYAFLKSAYSGEDINQIWNTRGLPGSESNAGSFELEAMTPKMAPGCLYEEFQHQRDQLNSYTVSTVTEKENARRVLSSFQDILDWVKCA